MEAKEILTTVTENVTKSLAPQLEGKATAEALETVEKNLQTAIEAKASSDDIAGLQKQLDGIKEGIESKNVNSEGVKAKEYVAKQHSAIKDILTGKGGQLNLDIDIKTFVAGTSSNTLVPSAYAQTGKITNLPTYKTQLRDVIMSRTESGGSIIWNRESQELDASGVKAFGAQAAETSKTLTRQESTFRTLTNYYTVPVEYFQDIANFSSWIQGRMMAQLMDEESNQLLTGDNSETVANDGTSTNYNGLNTFGSDLSPIAASLAAGRTAQDTALGAWANSVPSANRHDAITAVSSLLQEANFTADCVILNPFDYNQIKLIKDNQGQYVLERVFDTNLGMFRSFLGELEVVKHNAQTANRFTIIDKMAVEYVMRESINIDFDYSGDNFRRKQVAILASLRGNLADWNPTGVYTGVFNDVNAGASSMAGVIQGINS